MRTPPVHYACVPCAGGVGGALATVVTGTIFASIVPESFNKEDLEGTMGRSGYNHPVHGYNRGVQTQGSGPQGDMTNQGNRGGRQGQYNAL